MNNSLVLEPQLHSEDSAQIIPVPSLSQIIYSRLETAGFWRDSMSVIEEHKANTLKCLESAKKIGDLLNRAEVEFKKAHEEGHFSSAKARQQAYWTLMAHQFKFPITSRRGRAEPPTRFYFYKNLSKRWDDVVDYATSTGTPLVSQFVAKQILASLKEMEKTPIPSSWQRPKPKERLNDYISTLQPEVQKQIRSLVREVHAEIQADFEYEQNQNEILTQRVSDLEDYIRKHVPNDFTPPSAEPERQSRFRPVTA